MSNHTIATRILILCIVLSLLLTGSKFSVYAQSERDPVFEEEVIQRLEAINPEAVPIFIQATNSMDAGDAAAARLSFENVLKLAPDFPDALRRLSFVEIQLGLLDQALVHAEKAFNLEATTDNKIAYAYALLATNESDNVIQGSTLSKEVVQELPEDFWANNVLMIAALARGDYQGLRSASETLIRLEPEYPDAHFGYAIVLAQDGKWERAEAELRKARDLGLPDEFVDQLLQDGGIARNAQRIRIARAAGYLVVAWLVGMVLLFLIGRGLSKITLSAVNKAISGQTMNPSRHELRLRSIYHAVIGIISVYFYLSIPFIILVVVVIGGGIIYLFFSLGTIPTQLVVIIGGSVLYTIIAIIRSIFTRIKQQEPGRPLTSEEAPALWQLTDRIADQLHTQPIQAIYLTPGVEVAVMEQGRAVQKARGRGKRTLLLGLGVLSGMTQGQFTSILAHEYGHFTRKDTAGGDIAYRVQLSMYMMAFALIQTGQARWYNPAWLFLNGFYKTFLRITLGASRLQEILADRYAATAYGTRNFIDGLQHVIRQSLTFNFQFNYEVQQALENNAALKNLYILPIPPLEDAAQKLDEAVSEALKQPGGEYDSHPSPGDRIRYVEQLRLPERISEADDDRPAWELLPNADLLQQEMTAKVQQNIDARVKKV